MVSVMTNTREPAQSVYEQCVGWGGKGQRGVRGVTYLNLPSKQSKQNIKNVCTLYKRSKQFFIHTTFYVGKNNVIQPHPVLSVIYCTIRKKFVVIDIIECGNRCFMMLRGSCKKIHFDKQDHNQIYSVDPKQRVGFSRYFIQGFRDCSKTRPEDFPTIMFITVTRFFSY